MKRLVVLAAHPDDAESGCGGLISNLVDREWEAIIICMTRGEKAPSINPPDQNARIRTAEAKKGAEILGADVDFLGFIDGEVVADEEGLRIISRAVLEREPDVVLAHWPIDSHNDHQACGILALRTLLRNPVFQLYFYEVPIGTQTMNFNPTDHVDIGGNRERKTRACLAHRSQNPAKLLEHHELMEAFRGREIGVEFAGAYVRATRSPAYGTLPGA